jgi:hypothetical protein
MNFVKLHYRGYKDERRPVWVNLNKVWRIEPSGDGSTIQQSKDCYFQVWESPETIFNSINPTKEAIE